jgi:TusA-related sulfurtransferase
MNHPLDCRGLLCPMPIVRISRTMKGLRPGDTLTVTATDPSFAPDVEAWARKMNHTLVFLEDRAGVQTAVLLHSSPARG